MKMKKKLFHKMFHHFHDNKNILNHKDHWIKYLALQAY